MRGMSDAANSLDLQQENTRLKAQLAKHQRQLQNKDQRIRQLEEAILSLRHKQYGASSELNHQQAGLFDEPEADQDLEPALAAEEETSIEIAAHTRQRKPRVSLPPELPRQDMVYDLPDDQKVCPHDHTPLKLMGEQVHEQLDIVPAKIQVLRHIRKQYACPCCKGYIATAPKPKQPIEKSIASPGLLSHIALSKYADGLPLYRQTQMFKRIGVELDRTNLANWMVKAGELIQPLINLLQDKLHEQPVIHMDETVIQVLKEDGKTAQSQSYMWVQASVEQHSSPVVLFHYAPSRSQAVPVMLLSDYHHQTIMVDGYEGYQAACDQNQLTRLGCWAHARRKFVEAQRTQAKGKTGKPDQALAYITKLYRIEKSLKAQQATPEQIDQQRQEHAKPILEQLKRWLTKRLGHSPPKSAIGKALHYLDRQWPRLVGYLEDGLYPIDNNRAERAIRPFVIGRKNWLFSQSTQGAKASANLYSLIETAKANELNLYDYLKHVFTELPNAETVEDIEVLLPWRV